MSITAERIIPYGDCKGEYGLTRSAQPDQFIIGGRRCQVFLLTFCELYLLKVAAQKVNSKNDENLLTKVVGIVH